ncbi:MAG: ATP-binding cassette domain-containing protein, partial [Leptospiraceae bacterium]|nr:ATP-binding cassette domain-containing protein [Leptospiraceae bacterium]
MIRVENLTKYYNSFEALRGIDFNIPTGQVAGLLGLNGAGKTTCLRILTGFIMPTGGDCYIDGINVFDRPRDAKARIGYLPEQPPLYQELTVQDYLQFVARMRGGVEDFEQEFLRVTKLTWL